jgi:GNAT superfamily N-acetyltransferase
MNLSILLRKIQRNREDFGSWCTLKKGIFYFLKPIHEKRVYRIYGISLDRVKPIPYAENGLILKTINASDTQLISQIEKMEEWLSGEILLKLKKGGVCFVALDGDKVAGFNLINFGEVFIPLIKMKKIFKKDEAWSEQITVNKDYRGRGLATQLRFRVFIELKKKGIKRFYGGTLIDNEPNLKLTRKVGFQQLVDVHFSKLFLFKKWKYEAIRSEDEPRIPHSFN